MFAESDVQDDAFQVTCKMMHFKGLCNPVTDRCEGNVCGGVLCLSVCMYVYIYVCLRK